MTGFAASGTGLVAEDAGFTCRIQCRPGSVVAALVEKAKWSLSPKHQLLPTQPSLSQAFEIEVASQWRQGDTVGTLIQLSHPFGTLELELLDGDSAIAAAPSKFAPNTLTSTATLTRLQED